MNLIDVSFGLPAYLETYWGEYGITEYITDINSSLQYNYGNVNSGLITAIQNLHYFENNAETEGYTIVVGAGASQIISAVGYMAQKRGYNQILLKPPCWGRIKFLLEAGQGAAGSIGTVSLSEDKLYSENYFEFVTRPNNPNSTMLDPDEKFSVVDMCYNWSQYTKTVEKGNYDIMIFSLAKATGHAGTRIGWALVKDPSVAETMKSYIEQSTCGVSNDAQVKAEEVLRIVNQDIGTTNDLFTWATKKLHLRWNDFTQSVMDKSDISVLNSSGMFAFCELTIDTNQTPAEHMKDKYNLLVTGSASMGLTSNSKCFRINLGCSDKIFQQLIGVFNNGSQIEIIGN